MGRRLRYGVVDHLSIIEIKLIALQPHHVVWSGELCREGDGEPVGITVNSFTSVSLEPPLVLWNIARESRSTTAFIESGEFVVNVLAADQVAVSEHFAQPERPIFDNLSRDDTSDGQPVLADCIAYLYCRTQAIHEGGDHCIIVGEVTRHELGRDAAPLLYFGSRYRQIADV